MVVGIDPETLESGDVPGIYLAGSVSAGYETGNVFIENGRYAGEKVFDDATSREAAKRLGPLPGAPDSVYLIKKTKYCCPNTKN